MILKDLDNKIVSRGGEMIVLELMKKYLLQKTGVQHNTEANYNFIVNIIKKEAFGKKRIDKVKLSDAKCWFIKLQQDGRGYSSIHSVRRVVRPAFQMAVDDDLIRKNSFEFQLATIVVNDSMAREAITRKQERAFLEFMGLTLNDIDMQNRKINVNHQLQRKRNMEYVIEDTKTTSGMNPKMLQYLMGHSDIGVILNRGEKPINQGNTVNIRSFKDMIKILFVCHGNICRSTMCESYFTYLVNQSGLADLFFISSAATSREEIGNSPHYGTVRKLQEKGIALVPHRAVQMTAADYKGYDYLIGMDQANIRNMQRIAGGDPQNKIKKLLSFAGLERDVADPWYTGDFEATYQDTVTGCTAFLKFLKDHKKL